jgi:hypothetical protein
MPGATPDQDALRQQVRRWLSEGLLPMPTSDTWAGPGTGKLCVVCAAVIERSAIEYEVGHRTGRLFAHAACYTLWKKEADAAGGGSR